MKSPRRSAWLQLATLGLAVFFFSWWLVERSTAPSALAPEEQAESGQARTDALLDLPPLAEAPDFDKREQISTLKEQAAVVTVPVPPPVPEPGYWCRVEDARDGSPIRGARLRPVGSHSSRVRWTEERRSKGRPSVFLPTESDSAGLLELKLATGSRPVVRIDAAGYGPILFRVDKQRRTADNPIVLRLAVAAELVVTVLDSSSRVIQGVRVELTCPSYTIARTRGGMITLVDSLWTAQEEGPGRFALSNLPPDVSLQASAWLGRERLYREPSPLTFTGGEQREITWRIGSGATLRGTLLDQYGAPVATREVWITRVAGNARPERNKVYFILADKGRIHASAQTNAEGHFVFKDLPGGPCWVGPAALPDYTLSRPKPNDVAPVATRVTVAPGTAQEDLVLRVDRGLFIEGRVEQPDGAPVSSVYLRALSAEVGMTGRNSPGVDFRLGPLASGPHSLKARGTRTLTESEALVVMTGTRGVVLRLGEGASLAGRFFDAASGEECDAGLVTSGLDQSYLSVGNLPRPGPFLLTGLQPGRYDLTAHTADGRVGVLQNIALERGEARTDLTIELRPGARVRVRYSGPWAYGQIRISREKLVVAVDGLANGTVKSFHVPPGAWEVELRNGGELVETRTVFCEAGKEVDVVFERE